MSAKELQKVSFHSLMGGKTLQRVNEAIEVILDNFQDERASKFAKRRVQINIDMARSKDKPENILCQVTAKPVIAPFEDMDGVMYIAHDDNGEIVLAEPVPEQGSLFNFKEACKPIKRIQIISSEQS